jgi:hypothetical protein
MRRYTILALASAALAGAATAQTSVDIRTGPNGQLSGSATAGGASTSVDTGRAGDDRPGYAHSTRSEAHCTGNGRTMTVTSPDGSSSSSVSTSSSDGATTVGGGGSRGTRIVEGGCSGPRAVSAPAPRYDGGSATSASAAASSGPRHRIVHHRKRRARRH